MASSLPEAIHPFGVMLSIRNLGASLPIRPVAVDAHPFKCARRDFRSAATWKVSHDVNALTLGCAQTELAWISATLDNTDYDLV